jgi:oligosaccharide repeat unit polymerase
LFAAAWTIFLAIPVLFLREMDDFGPAAWIIVAMIFFSATSAPLALKPDQVKPSTVKSGRLLNSFVFFGSVSAGLSALITQRANGISLSESLSLESITSASRLLTVLRYDGTMTSPQTATLFLGLTYGAALAAPFAAAGSRGFKRLALLCAPALGGALYALMTTARAGLLIAVAITAGSWLVVYAVRHGGRPKFSAKVAIGAITAGAAVAGMFIFVAASRGGGFDLVTASALTRSVALYSGGSIPAFNTWLGDVAEPLFGMQTFAGVAQFFVSDDSLGSAYTGFASIGAGYTTNVFTALRPLAEDFTLAGMIIVVGVFAWVAAYAYRRAITRNSVTAAVICAAWLGFTLFSQTTSIFSFVNVTFGVVVGGFLVIHQVTVTHADTLEAPPLADAVPNLHPTGNYRLAQLRQKQACR